ncbi:MAG: S-adenosylmethionine:tRNA ribosyltransferase-isomerase [Candidatus Magasanikbacteria bacterium]|nr:S-adenosylmethionine:tRNA ribosyltransferase-isomerase [Candidatus Magasanikbacteria bacterium]
MFTSLFDYLLPKELIAQESIQPRDHSRLMIFDRRSGSLKHRHFFDLPKFLRPGDLLVFNDTKVFKARLLGAIRTSANTGEPRGRDAEIFLLRPTSGNNWEALGRPGKILSIGTRVEFTKKFWCEVTEKFSDGRLLVKFPMASERVIALANRVGHIPVPPYIKTEPQNFEEYQTIFAKRVGSVAAPTASFHFTKHLLRQLKSLGVKTTTITLHVGVGTFRPVKAEKIEDHTMHSEWVQIDAAAAQKIRAAKKKGRRVIAVGTTAVRALEGVAQKNGSVKKFSGDINIFITPAFQFQIIDGLITNFHLPKSTLLMLVAAFVGRQTILAAYKKAIAKKYRFFSFGDAMFIASP